MKTSVLIWSLVTDLNEAFHLIEQATPPTLENAIAQVPSRLQLMLLANLILLLDTVEYSLNVSCGRFLFSFPL